MWGGRGGEEGEGKGRGGGVKVSKEVDGLVLKHCDKGGLTLHCNFLQNVY